MAALFIIAKIWKLPKCPSNRSVDKKEAVYIYSGISAIKNEQIWVSWNEVDIPIACYTEWSQSEREKQILYY